MEKKNLIMISGVIFLIIGICFSTSVSALPPNQNKQNIGYKIINFDGATYIYTYVNNMLNEPMMPIDFFPKPRSSGTLGSAPGPVSSSWVQVARTGEGHIESQKSMEKGWTPIWNARLLRKGDKIQTLDNGHATLTFKGGGSITIGPNTGIEITSDLIKGNVKKLSIKQVAGRLYVQVLNFMGKDIDFELHTPGNGVIAARGTEFEVRVEDDKDEVIVYEGSVSMKSNYDGTEKIVNAGEKGILYPDKPSEVIKFEDNIPLEIVMKDLCDDPIITTVEYTDNLTKALFEESLPEGTSSYDLKCELIETRPEFTFFTNKFLDPSTVNKDTFIVSDERNNQVGGYLDVSNTITFIPDKPLYGKIKILLKKGSICSKFGVCLEKDISYEIQGVEYKENSDYNFRLTPADPIKIIREVKIVNNGSSEQNGILSIPSFGTYYPNVYYKLHEVSPNIDYDLTGNKNKFFEININLEPEETLIYNLTYVGLSFGREYYQYIDVSDINTYENLEIVNKFTLPEEGIESDDPKIIELSNNIVGEEKNPFWKAYKIYNWITTTIKYNFDEEYSGGALAVIERKEGVCEDYTELFMALARAQKIPTRFVGLYMPDDFEKGHAIPEIYIEKIGWIPLDPTWGTNFDNFARQLSGFITIFKEETGSEKNYPYHLKGENTNNLNVSIVTNAYLLEIGGEGEEEWVSYFGDSFLKNIYELVAISNINLEMDNQINYYNRLSQKKLFKESFNQVEKNPFYIISNSVSSYENGNFNENELKETFIEQLSIAITTFSEMVDYTLSKDLGGYTFTIDNETITPDEATITLNNAKEEINIARDQFNSEGYIVAFTKFVNVYLDSYDEVSNTLISLISFDALENKIPLTGKGAVFTLIIFVLGILMIISAFVFWIWMFIKCLIKKEFRHLNKFLWIIIILFVFLIGPLLYFILEYLNRSKTISKGKRDDK